MTGKKEESVITLLAVGDVMVDSDKPESLFAYTAPILREADIAFCQQETNYSERGSLNPIARHGGRSHPRNASALKFAGFDIVSGTNNHQLAYGYEAFFDTIEILRQLGIVVVGVGKDIDEARQPAVLERKGTKVGFLAYNTILPPGYMADVGKPGCAPMRALTLYEPLEPDQPGTPARIRTFAHREDLGAMIQGIKKVKAAADIVVVSFHWGLHLVRTKLADYQKEVAYAAIDAGADLILGHHAHILKGIEIYKGKYIFYSLGNFALQSDFSNVLVNPSHKMRLLMELYDWEIDPEWAATYPFPPDCRKTMIAKCIIADKKIQRVSFLPAMINKQSQPAVLTKEQEDFGHVLKYMQDISEEAGLNTKFWAEGNEILVTPGA
jgi:hypothetical protein